MGRSRRRDRANRKNRWSIVRQSRERDTLASHRFVVIFLFSIRRSACSYRTKNSSAQRAPSWREERELRYRFLIVSLSYCSAVSVLLNLRLVDSLVAPRREQSGAKNIPREAPLRHFLSGVFLFSSIPVRYPRACRAFDNIGDITRWRSCFIDIRIDQRRPTIASLTIWFRRSIVPAFHQHSRETSSSSLITAPTQSRIFRRVIIHPTARGRRHHRPHTSEINKCSCWTLSEILGDRQFLKEIFYIK